MSHATSLRPSVSSRSAAPSRWSRAADVSRGASWLGAAAFAGLMASSAQAVDLTYQLRLSDGGNAQNRTVTGVGQQFLINVYGIVTDPSGNTDNEGFSFGYGSILSTTTVGGVAGDLSNTGTGVGLSGSFSAPSSSLGQRQDLNGDGHFDLGSNAASLTDPASMNGNQSAFFLARSGGVVTNGTRPGNGTEEFLLGTVLYTVTAADVAASSSTVNFRLTNFPGNQRYASFQQDGAIVTDLNNDSDIVVGAPITFGTGVADAYFTGNNPTNPTLFTADTNGDTNFSSNPQGTIEAGTLPGSNTNVHFNAQSNQGNATTVDLGDSRAIRGLTFDNANAPVTINGTNNNYSLTIGTAGITTLDTGAHTINAALDLSGGRTVSVNAGGSLTMSKAITNGTNDTLTFTGAGPKILSGNSTGTLLGTVNLTAGPLRATALGSLGSLNTLNLSNASTLQFANAVDHASNTTTLNLAGGSSVSLLNGASEGSLNGGGLGNLSLDADGFLNYGASGGLDGETIAFNDFLNNSKTLHIQNYVNSATLTGANYSPSALSTDDHLVFDQSQENNLSFFDFGTGFTARQIDLGNGFFEIVADLSMSPVPEASTVYGCLGLLGLVGWRQRRQLRSLSRLLLSPQ